MSQVIFLTVFTILVQFSQCATPQPRTSLRGIVDFVFNIGREFYFPQHGNYGDTGRFDCPVCDSSVYSYCGDKLVHDACCCLDPYEYQLPSQCRYADCDFLHANSCREHKLITACCCSRLA